MVFEDLACSSYYEEIKASQEQIADRKNSDFETLGEVPNEPSTELVGMHTSIFELLPMDR